MFAGRFIAHSLRSLPSILIQRICRSCALNGSLTYTALSTGEKRPHSSYLKSSMSQSLSDEEDEQLRLAIQLSLQESAAHRDAAGRVGNTDRDDPLQTQSSDRIQSFGANITRSAATGLLGLDRRAMEQERLARLGKAKDSPQPRHANSEPAELPAKRMRSSSVNSPVEESRSKRQRSFRTSTDSASVVALPPVNPPGPTHPSSSPRSPGLVKKTWCLGSERTNRDIKLEELLQKNTLQLAVLSSFIWDVDWILAKLNPNTKVVMVMSVKDEDAKSYFRRQANELHGRSVRVCFPPMPGNVTCMHSKLMLLAHPGYLRVAVPTANLVPFDWGETGVMENSVFYIDLPRFSQGHAVARENLTDFGQELYRFCEAMGIGDDLLQSLGNFDFSATKGMGFVHTIGGEHRSEDSWRHTGYPGLGRAIRHLGLQSQNPIRMDFVTSSVGALTDDFLQMLYLSCKGDDGLTEYRRRTSKKRSAKMSSDTEEQQVASDRAAIRNGLKIYFPSHDTVIKSRGGPDNGGTICFQQRWYHSPSFPQSVLHDCQSVRNGLLMHNKLIFVRQDGTRPSLKADGTNAPRAWAYVGSANCSESAWGRLVKDRVSQQPKLTCRNWECGVVIPTRTENCSYSEDSEQAASTEDLEIFADTVAVPMRLPAKRLSEHNMLPWFFND